MTTMKQNGMSLKNLTTGESFQDTSDVLISAQGNLNNMAWPEIEGLRSFKGEIMHYAKWNEKYDFTNKKVGVIGSGSSAIQIVPSNASLVLKYRPSYAAKHGFSPFWSTSVG